MTSIIAHPVRRLDSIGLDALVQTADLQNRVDRKYVLDRHRACTLLAALPDDTRVLEINGRRHFHYESVYFDTDDLRSYLGAALRRRRRFKVRTRTYLDSGERWIEVKTRSARGGTLKQRARHSADTLYLGDGREFVVQALASGGITNPEQLDLQACMATRYERTTILVPDADGDSRLTVDASLSWIDPGTVLPAPEMVIIETKTAGGASRIDRALWRAGHRPQRISKYGTGLALLHPELPHTPWKRVISRHLDDVRPRRTLMAGAGGAA